MARFVFPLQPLLDERRRKEKEKQLAFVRVKAACEERSRELDRLAGALRARGRALHEWAMTGSTAILRLYDAHLRYLARAIESGERCNVESAAAFDRAAADLLDANRERRLIEKLKERRLREFEREEARRDELELDEANARPSSFDGACPERSRRAQDDKRLRSG
ncbi:MAG: flagellar export protein FliJ [Candidatus Cybelea sp.]|jgi:flagellar export protein FliJ